MKKFYELRMKDGRSFITSTDTKGVCQFSINGKEFSIYTEGEGSNSFTFSAELDWDAGGDLNLRLSQKLDVVSLQELTIKNKGELGSFIREQERSGKKAANGKETFLNWEGNFYIAKHGGIQTPAGWLYA